MQENVPRAARLELYSTHTLYVLLLVRISVPGEMLSMLKSPDMTANAVLSPDFSFRFRKTLNSALGQFHQHFTSSFCTEIILPKNYKAKL